MSSSPSLAVFMQRLKTNYSRSHTAFPVPDTLQLYYAFVTHFWLRDSEDTLESSPTACRWKRQSTMNEWVYKSRKGARQTRSRSCSLVGSVATRPSGATLSSDTILTVTSSCHDNTEMTYTESIAVIQTIVRPPVFLSLTSSTRYFTQYRPKRL